MLGRRRAKAFEEELAVLKSENEQKEGMLSDILKQKDRAAEQFARMTASHAQFEKDVNQIKEQVTSVFEQAEKREKTTEDICRAMLETKNGISAFDARHSAFVGQMRAQSERIVEIVENNKHFTTPMKYITEIQPVCREECRRLNERAKRMKDISGNMSILALNAAIEAGKLGEAGNSFLSAAEEIRALSEKYEGEVQEMQEELAQTETRNAELEEQVHRLNELLKENNISMNKLYKGAAQNMLTYEESQTRLQDLMWEETLKKAEAVRESEKENVKLQEYMHKSLENICAEVSEYKSGADELETLWKEICQKIQ